MGSINKGSFQLNKAGNMKATQGNRFNNSSKFGNTKSSFKDVFKTSINKTKKEENK